MASGLRGSPPLEPISRGVIGRYVPPAPATRWPPVSAPVPSLDGPGLEPGAPAAAPPGRHASSNALMKTAVAGPLTTSPQTLAAYGGREAPNANAAVDPSHGAPSMAGRPWAHVRRTSCFRKTSRASLWRWPDQESSNSARLRRDLSLALRRRLTLYAGIGAAGLTVVFSLVAAATIPGQSKTATVPSATQDPQATLPSTGGEPAFNVPAQLPQSGFSGRPSAVSGGS